MKFLICIFLSLMITSKVNSQTNLLNGENVLIYKKYNIDSFALIQLIFKNDSIVYVQNCELKCNLDTIRTFNYSTFDSLFRGIKIRRDIEVIVKTLIYDTIEVTIDNKFFSNNSVYSLTYEEYYVKFNAFKVEEPYSVNDLPSLFITNIDTSRLFLKFWSNNFNRPFDYSIYIFKRNFWLISYCDKNCISNCYVLNYINKGKYELNLETIMDLF